MQTNDFSNLPTSWQIKTLGEIYDITSSKRVFKDEWKTDGIPFYRARDLVSFSKNEPIKNPLFISETMYNEYSSKYGIPLEDDILVTGVGTIGIPYLVKANEKFYFKDGNILWFKKRASNIFSKYVYYLFLSNLLDTNSKGSTVLTYTIINAKNTKIPLPPLEIQKRIVARLERAFEKIEKGSAHLQDAKTKLAKYKQSLLKSAFDGTLTATASLQGVEKAETIHKVDCHDLTSSKLAMTDKENPKLPQGWAIKTLGEVFKVVGGGTPSTAKTEFWNGNIAWITSADIDLQSFIITPKRFITNEAIQSSTTNCVEKDIIIVVTRVGLGKVGITDRQTCFSQDSQALIPLENVNVKFMAFQIKNQAKNFISVSRGTTINGITKNTLKELKLVVPPLETQKQIVKLLEKHLQHADKTDKFIESALNKAKQLKQSLLKSAFLGKLT